MIIRRAFLLLAIIATSILADRASAHEVRPAYLEIRETQPEIYEILWKVPAKGDLRLSLEVALPEDCETVRPVTRVQARGAFVDRWAIRCPGGLTGKTVEIEGLSGTLTDALVRIEHTDGVSQTARLNPSNVSFVVDAAPTGFQVSGTYLGLGVEHILRGIDHLLFVFALLMLVKGWRKLVGTVTAFTVAHSITLAAATLGVLRVPQQPIEAMIAFSIVFVAAEIVHGMNDRPGITNRAPWIVAFVFGLLHGFGFAGALKEVGLPPQSIPLALLFFNVGVEIGQLLFIAAVVFLVAAARKTKIDFSARLRAAPAYGIGCIAAYWTIDRIVGFWP